jgi:DNA polymerase
MLQPTFDILNCGPRHRFVANGKLVHNSQKINLQNLGRGSNLRKAITAPKGKLVYVADSSNIEARMNNWNAGQLDMVEKFRTGTDVYSDFAGDHIYHMPVNKHDNPLERFVGKVAVLGLGYGMGAGKFRETLAVGAMGPQVFIDDQEAFGVVNAYRKAHYMIQRYWQTGDLMLAKMLDPKCDEPWGVLHVLHNMIVLPNGMALQYPGLRAHEDPRNGSLSFEYWNGKYWKSIWGGSLTENIIQALSRIVLFDQMLDINTFTKELDPTGRACLNVHDEIITVASDFGARKSPDGHWVNDSEAREYYDGIEAILRTPLDWCQDLPLDCEGGWDYCYSK